ncbi:MAG: hypothetical protein HZC28_06720 [Spirochaetes bacterium]|nr:hypothetical protein [Spirochaetota bacterium]
MQSKLTLLLDKEVITHAKEYSKKKHTSISSIVENYLKSLDNKRMNNHKSAPITRQLKGMVKGGNISSDYKDIIAERLSKKYL